MSKLFQNCTLLALMNLFAFGPVITRVSSQCENAGFGFVELPFGDDGVMHKLPGGYFLHGNDKNFTVRDSAGVIDFIQYYSASAHADDYFVDDAGNIYVCGRYAVHIVLGDGYEFDGNEESAGMNIFFCKYDLHGNVLWAHSSYEYQPVINEIGQMAFSIVADNLGKCYLYGGNGDVIQFGPEFPSSAETPALQSFLLTMDQETGELEEVAYFDNYDSSKMSGIQFPHPDGGVVIWLDSYVPFLDGTVIEDPEAGGFFIHFGTDGLVLDHQAYLGDLYPASPAIMDVSSYYDLASETYYMLFSNNDNFAIGNEGVVCYGEAPCLNMLTFSNGIQNIQVERIFQYNNVESLDFKNYASLVVTQNNELYIALGITDDVKIWAVNGELDVEGGYLLFHLDAALNIDWWRQLGEVSFNNEYSESHGLIYFEERCILNTVVSNTQSFEVEGMDFDNANVLLEYACTGIWCEPFIAPPSVEEIPDRPIGIQVKNETVIVSSDAPLGMVRLIDSSGRTLGLEDCGKQQSYSWLLSGMPSGPYFIQTSHGSGSFIWH